MHTNKFRDKVLHMYYIQGSVAFFYYKVAKCVFYFFSPFFHNHLGTLPLHMVFFGVAAMVENFLVFNLFVWSQFVIRCM